MSEQYGDRRIVHFLERPIPTYIDSDHSPLFVTLLPWFYVPESRQDELQDELRIIARRTEPISVKTEGEERFGRRHNVPVRLLGAESLRAIHYKFTNTVIHLKGEIRPTEFRGRLYQPHITQQNELPLPGENEKINVDSFSLVHIVDTPHADREVTNTYKLEG